MEETKERRSKATEVVGFTTLEVLLFFMMYTLFVAGVALGGGYYLGHQNTQTAELVDMCQTAINAQDRAAEAERINAKAVKARLTEFETFLLGVGVEPTLPLDKTRTARIIREKRTAQGGP